MAPPKLLDQLRAAIRLKHYSLRTEDAYVYWARDFIQFHGKRHPRELGDADIVSYLSHLAVHRRVAASTQNLCSPSTSAGLAASARIGAEGCGSLLGAAC